MFWGLHPTNLCYNDYDNENNRGKIQTGKKGEGKSVAKPRKYKYEKGDEVGLYRVIKALPRVANVRNLVIYCECLLCGEKVERWSNRMDSTHRGCPKKADVKIIRPLPEIDEELPTVTVKPHTRKDGTVVVTDERGYVVNEDGGEDLLEGDLDLPAQVTDALNFDVNAYVEELVKKAESMDVGSRFTFMSTLRRYVALVHLARKLELKLAHNDNLTVEGSSGNQVANPLITQYKTVSAESNQTARILNSMVAKLMAKETEDDPLAKLLGGA